MVDRTAELLETRGREYGSFKDVAHLTYKYERDASLSRMSPGAVRLALFMIVHKLARCMNSPTGSRDSVEDIFGYLALAKASLYKHEDEEIGEFFKFSEAEESALSDQQKKDIVVVHILKHIRGAVNFTTGGHTTPWISAARELYEIKKYRPILEKLFIKED